ncbi:MAG: glycoside hydrolase family 13 protein [Chloroflexota bacterium]|nr:glycoside hydrolase family 13 protein [Chloroflexota bacterium]
MPIDTPDWVRDAVFYQIFPDRFAASDRVRKPGRMESWDSPPTTYGFKGGDLLGVAERLPYLADLGVTALYLTPVFSSAANHRYHAYDYFHVDPLLGGNDALRELLDDAHGRGMRVILDGVFNHTGRGFWPFHHVLEAGAASPYRNWFYFDQAALDAGRPVLAYPEAVGRDGAARNDPGPVGTAGPHDGRASLEQLGYRAWWDLPALPKLNVAEPAVRDYLLSVAEYWIRFGADGWRLDVPSEIDEATFWPEFRRRVRAVNPEAYLVGEIWSLAPDWLRGDRFDALMNYPLAEAILSFAGAGHLNDELIRSHHEYGARVSALDGPAFAARLGEVMTAYDPAVTAVQMNLLDSHDSPRFHSMVGGDRTSYRLALLLIAALPGAPCVYYGDEVGIDGGLDPDNRRAFPWREEAWDRDLRSFVRASIALRRDEPALRRGSFRVAGAGAGAIAIERRMDDRRLLLVVNNGAAETSLAVDLPGAAGCRLEVIPLPDLPAASPPPTMPGDQVTIKLPPRSGTIVRLA